MKTATIAFIGCGNMGASLIGGLIADGHPADRIRGVDPDPDKRARLADRYGITVGTDSLAIIRDADVVILAVKPQAMATTLASLADAIRDQPVLLVSIAAGIRLATLEAMVGGKPAIVRVMPNTPALIRAGASALRANDHVSADQKQLAETIMRSVGLAVWLDDEDQMDAVTAVSGSGPAYYFLVMEVMEKAAVSLGLSPQQARLLTLETAFGAAKMALESEADAATLRRQVTSPGGTTEQALKVLMEQGRLEDLFREALTAARDRSEELAALYAGDS